MRICKYKYCDKHIGKDKILQIRYCSVKHRSKQLRLNKMGRLLEEEKMKIEERKKVFIEKQIPTIITPQASRYQDLLRYSTTVMSEFK